MGCSFCQVGDHGLCDPAIAQLFGFIAYYRRQLSFEQYNAIRAHITTWQKTSVENRVSIDELWEEVRQLLGSVCRGPEGDVTTVTQSNKKID